jgi:hypothetical protein
LTQGLVRLVFHGIVHLVLDMETRDPDDVLTLAPVATHPAVRLTAVTVNPGTPAQLGVVRTVLDRLGVAVPVGARVVGRDGDAVSRLHRTWLGATLLRAVPGVGCQPSVAS